MDIQEAGLVLVVQEAQSPAERRPFASDDGLTRAAEKHAVEDHKAKDPQG